MLISNEITKAESENAYELKKLEWKVTQHQIIQALQSADNEIEYQNLFWTLQKVLPKLNPWKQKQQVDPDKMKRLKDLSKEFSSDDMQEIIAWILAGEYNQPWSYSLRTMEIVRHLSKNEIEMFKKYCWLIINGYFILSELTNTTWNDFRKNNWLEYTEFLYLQELWLISFKESSLTLSTMFSEWQESWGQTIFNIGSKSLFMKYKTEQSINIFTITNSWKELVKLLEFYTPETYYQWINETLQKKWFETEFLWSIK